jgi:hypothetical protein
MVTQILLVIGLKRGVLLGLLVLLGFECKILLGLRLLLACMRTLKGLYKQGLEAICINQANTNGLHPKLARSN